MSAGLFFLAYIVMAYVGMADIVVAAYMVTAFVVMAGTVMAYIVMAAGRRRKAKAASAERRPFFFTRASRSTPTANADRTNGRFLRTGDSAETFPDDIV